MAICDKRHNAKKLLCKRVARVYITYMELIPWYPTDNVSLFAREVASIDTDAWLHTAFLPGGILSDAEDAPMRAQRTLQRMEGSLHRMTLLR